MGSADRCRFCRRWQAAAGARRSTRDIRAGKLQDPTVTGRTHRRFWKCFEALPAPVQRLAREKYALWKRDPYHASLRFEEWSNWGARHVRLCREVAVEN